ncbi:MAG: TonB-dependent receptor [Leptolyngbya sp. SIOISBB]|nr:TonB-dependent receptor [Leptolyngbya sp. SIOISBB]
MQHTLLVGVDLSRVDNRAVARFDFSQAFPTPINIFDPEYSSVPNPSTESLPLFFDNDIRADRLGIYLQDQIDILDNLMLVAGLRYDTVETNLVSGTNVFGPEEETNQTDDAFTPRIGIVYQPIEPISLYANYARSFNPSFNTFDANGDSLPPEEGEGFEVGIRGEIIENRLTATLAYFDITKQNVATADPIPPFASVATG